MLKLTRKLGERIAVGDDITITFLEIKGKQVKVGIEAPRNISVHRQEIYEKIRSENLESSGVYADDLSNAANLLTKIDNKDEQ
jgi:carbon storage regulator